MTSTAGPEARKAEYPTSRLSTGRPQLEYRNDLESVLIPQWLGMDQHILHKPFADYCTMGDRDGTFG